MSDVQADIAGFFSYARRTAKTLGEMRAPMHAWADESGVKVHGWSLARGDYKTVEDINTKRTPIYMGGTWGHWEEFLGEDGVIYEYQFRGSETYENDEIVTTTSESIQKKRVGALMGRGERFADARGKLDLLIANNYEQ